eukprot:jgi/Botrbrau1/7040/Bobra.0165s0063.1
MNAPAMQIGSCASSTVIPVFAISQRRFSHGIARQRPCSSGVRRKQVAVKAAAFQLVQSSGKAFDVISFLQTRGVRDGCACVFTTAAALALVKTINYLATKDVLDTKLSRKLIHVLAGPGLVACWPLFSDYPEARIFAALVPLFNLIRLGLIGFGITKDESQVKSVSREGDRSELLKGPSYYLIVLIILSLLFWRDSLVACATVSMMCGGDGLADIVGRQIGSAKLPWNKQKSWAGSLAMFGGGLLMTIGYAEYFSRLGYFTITFPLLPIAVVISLAATIVESLPINKFIDDNISVPLATTGLALLLMESVSVLS